MNVPANPKNFDYGLKKLQKRAQRPVKVQQRKLFQYESTDEEQCQPAQKLPDKTFLPVNLVRWEDDIFYDVEQARESVSWILSSNNK